MSDLTLMYPFFSALLGLLIISIWLTQGSRILVNLLTLKGLKIAETDSKSWVLALILLALFNSNQIVGAQYPFFIFIFSTFIVLVFAWITFPSQLLREAMYETLEILLIGLISLITVIVIYKGWQYWLHEGPNHDSLVYFEGLMWALDRPLLVGSEAVRSHWGLNGCDQNGIIIGVDCGLYRGGTYTLAAWTQFFSPYKTGNGLYGLFSFVGLFAWVAVGMLVGKANIGGARDVIFRLFLSLLLLFSTAVLSALTNDNLATMLGAASIAMMVAVLANRSKPILHRCLLAGLWVAIAAHFYAESIFYAGLIVLIAVAVEFLQTRQNASLKEIIFSLLGFGLVLLIAANYVIVYAVQSLFLFKSISQGGNWPAWYIDAPPWTWLGGFIAAPVFGPEISSFSVATCGALVLLLTLLILCFNRKYLPIIVSVSLTSALAVWYIEVSSYRYGEHKILQLLGVSWSLLLIFAIIELQSRKSNWILKGKLAVSICSLLIFVIVGVKFYVISDFFTRSMHLIKANEPAHGIYPGIEKLVSYIRPGDRVLLDDSAWFGVEKFQKAHYLTFLVHNQGGRVVMSNHGDEVLRGGYHKNEVNNTFLNNSEQVQWYVSGQPALGRTLIFHQTNVDPIVATKNYSLFRVLQKSSALIVPGEGWTQCEATHCWTTGSFTTEVYVADSGKPNEFTLESDYFMPPKNGQILVTVNGKNLPSMTAGTHLVKIPIEAGISKIQLSPSWDPVSPQQLGVSSDPRKLFLMVKSVGVTQSERSSNLIEK